jgi:anaerobic selenocysteine-containing dehydrogenase
LLIRNDQIDRDFLAARTVGFDELAKLVSEYPPARAAAISGVAQSQIEAAARLIGEADSLLSTCLQGVYQSNQATAAAVQVNNVNLVRGMIGRPGFVSFGRRTSKSAGMEMAKNIVILRCVAAIAMEG